MFKDFRISYDTETVRQMMELAVGESVAQMDLWNLCKPGKLLHKAVIRPGVFSVSRTRKAIAKLLRRRLAASLGRTSPRFLDPDHDRECHTCKGLAVEWERSVLCENNHLLCAECDSEILPNGSCMMGHWCAVPSIELHHEMEKR